MAYLPLIALAWLWFRLIDNLRVEWAVNPQYAYGWAVPFLCLYLVWKGLRDHGPVGRSGGRAVGRSGGRAVLFGFFVLAFLYLPTRLIEEANPEWRLVSWALALEVVGITLLVFQSTVHSPRGAVGRSGSGAVSEALKHCSTEILAFPVCFFLVVVPWPTFIEAPVVQGLMRANAAVTVGLIGAVGVPAIQHGNVIEVATGMVGIDEACSGIRSLQATLMISLFLGELYRLSVARRLVCVGAGVALSFVFNVSRTSLLTLVAASQGVAAIASWHDPAGITILVWCFLLLWMLAMVLAGVISFSRSGPRDQGTKGLRDHGAVGRSGGEAVGRCFGVSVFRWGGVFLLGWLVVVEGGTEVWYRAHEWGLPRAVEWRIELPREKAGFREVPFSEKTKQLLRYDEGINGAWEEADGSQWQAIFLRWNPGRIAVHLAKSHTPEVCLTAAGHELVSQSELHAVAVHGLQLPFRSYLTRDERGPVHVFYCLWDDRTEAQGFSTTTLTYGNRLGPVLAGRRNSGQRSLEVAVSGLPEGVDAEAELGRVLAGWVKVGRSGGGAVGRWGGGAVGRWGGGAVGGGAVGGGAVGGEGGRAVRAVNQ